MSDEAKLSRYTNALNPGSPIPRSLPINPQAICFSISVWRMLC